MFRNRHLIHEKTIKFNKSLNKLKIIFTTNDVLNYKISYIL